MTNESSKTARNLSSNDMISIVLMVTGVIASLLGSVGIAIMCGTVIIAITLEDATKGIVAALKALKKD